MGDFDCFLLAGRYTLLEQEPLDAFLPLCEQRGVAVIIGGGFNSGILATGSGPDARYNYGPAPPEILRRVRRIEAICARCEGAASRRGASVHSGPSRGRLAHTRRAHA